MRSETINPQIDKLIHKAKFWSDEWVMIYLFFCAIIFFFLINCFDINYLSSFVAILFVVTILTVKLVKIEQHRVDKLTELGMIYSLGSPGKKAETYNDDLNEGKKSARLLEELVIESFKTEAGKKHDLTSLILRYYSLMQTTSYGTEFKDELLNQLLEVYKAEIMKDYDKKIY